MMKGIRVLRNGARRLSARSAFIVIAILLGLSPFASFAQKWEIACDGEFANFYYDSSSVKIMPNDIVQVLVKREFLSDKRSGFTEIFVLPCQSVNQEFKGIQGKCSHEVDLYQFNCKTNEARTLFVTYFSDQGRILCMDNERGHEWKKMDQYNDSCIRLVYDNMLVLLFTNKQ